MDIARIVPEYHITLDPITGIVAEEREDLIMFSLVPIENQLDILEDVADDLINSLTPDKPLLSSYAGREDASRIAGFYANLFYGIVIGLAIAFMAAMMIIKMRGGL
ncbi:MAG: tetrahydromethanopterin S-methyltransferase subunit B [Methanosarcinales archaeon]|nr:tetrahydromethanopterin S-methyltransferase subunit B [Methanosarcinales archaeon]RLG23063.1 MAG: tetrahydromethanopterin S-methyltransferase subunit B [Methanosarcinales archaeon]